MSDQTKEIENGGKRKTFMHIHTWLALIHSHTHTDTRSMDWMAKYF